MPVTSIDPNSVRQSESGQRRAVSNSPSFSEFVNAAAPATTVAVGTQSYQAAAVTSATMTGVAGAASSAANSPYSSPMLGTATLPYAPVGGGYGATSIPSPTGVANVSAGVPGAPGDDTAARTALFHEMNDANWEMLTAQVTINNLSRDYQARSNILKTKSDTEMNAVRNMRG